MSEQNKTDMERLDLIWGRTSMSRRGPKQSLTVEQIAHAAIELADTAGIDAVSMKRVAEVLNVGTMTLYTYVPDKATLLLLMLDRAVGQADLPDVSSNWRDHLYQTGEALLQLHLNHPWTMQINVDGPPVTPHQVRYMESALQTLHMAGLTQGESLDIALSVSYYVLGAARLAGGVVKAEEKSSLSAEEMHAGRSEMFKRILDPEEFPMVLEAMTMAPPGASHENTLDSLGFRFGLERLLDGIAAYIEGSTR